MKYNEETFKKEVFKLYGDEIKVVSRYKGLTYPIQVEDKYGVMLVTTARQVLKFRPSINAALNKTQYFMNQLKEVYPEIAESIEPVSEYQGMNKKFLVKDKFGIMSVYPSNIIQGHKPNIRSAIDRKSYFKNQLLFIYDNKYDFEITSTNRHEGKVTLICPIHGKVEVDSDGIFLGNGCPKCNKDWKDPNVFYLVKLYNDNESFYKLGISHRLKNGKISRFHSYSTLGYDIEIIKLITFKESMDCKEFELKMKRIIKDSLYVPKHWDYPSSTETFTDSLLNVTKENINNIKYDIVSTSSESQSKIGDGNNEPS